MKGDLLYLSNIVECVGQIEQYVAGGREVFVQHNCCLAIAI